PRVPPLRAAARVRAHPRPLQGQARLGGGPRRAAAGRESRRGPAPRHAAIDAAQLRVRVRQPARGFRRAADRGGGPQGHDQRPGADQRSPRELHRQPGRRAGGRRGGADRARQADRAGEVRRRAAARSAAGGRLRAGAAGGAGAASSKARAAGRRDPGGDRGSGHQAIAFAGAAMTFKALQMAQVRRAEAERDRAAWKSVLGAALRTLLAAVLSAAVSLGAWEGWRWATSSEAFAIREIRFEGLSHATEQDLLHRSGLKPGDNLFRADLAKAGRAMQANPWVASARLARRLPGQVVATVVEHRPAAL